MFIPLIYLLTFSVHAVELGTWCKESVALMPEPNPDWKQLDLTVAFIKLTFFL